jgi:hypothetical protein
MRRRKRLIAIAVSLAFIVYIAIALYATRDKWLPWVSTPARPPGGYCPMDRLLYAVGRGIDHVV